VQLNELVMSTQTTEGQWGLDARAQRELGPPRQMSCEDAQSIERVQRVQDVCVVEHENERRRSLE
jgi:hypothetical protein